MICLSQKLPILQIGQLQLTDYPTDWIEDSISAALTEADAYQEDIVNHIYLGILHYLQNDCPWTPLRIEALRKRIQQLLNTIGYSHCAASLPDLGPPIRLSVLETLERLDTPIELQLIQNLKATLEDLSAHGVSEVQAHEIEEAVKAIIKPRRWNKACDQLSADIHSLFSYYSNSSPCDSV